MDLKIASKNANELKKKNLSNKFEIQIEENK